MSSKCEGDGGIFFVSETLKCGFSMMLCCQQDITGTCSQILTKFAWIYYGDNLT